MCAFSEYISNSLSSPSPLAASRTKVPRGFLSPLDWDPNSDCCHQALCDQSPCLLPNLIFHHCLHPSLSPTPSTWSDLSSPRSSCFLGLCTCSRLSRMFSFWLFLWLTYFCLQVSAQIASQRVLKLGSELFPSYASYHILTPSRSLLCFLLLPLE